MNNSTPSTDVPGLAFLRYVLESIIEDKDELVIESRLDELGILLTVQVSDRDMGKLIGKSGQTVKALRTLLRILGGNLQQRINLKILEPPTSSTPS
ncbi:KH domain-containing protein [Candidatus Peribacteria bacterium]|nr:MAG: KH domain-containing protein [Candidatus Peribacteria bacterium]